jgi:hypothetical protein
VLFAHEGYILIEEFVMRSLVIFLLLVGTTAFSQVYYFAGKIDNRYPVTLRLENQEGELRGQYRYGDNVEELQLQGTAEPELLGGQVKVWALEESAGETWTGSWRGQFDGRSFQGTWSDRLREFGFFLQLVALEVQEKAQYSPGVYSQITYPKFIHPDYEHWNTLIEEDFLSYHRNFEEEIIETLVSSHLWPVLGFGTELTVSFPSLSQERIALAAYGYEYTGGAHGNQVIITSNARQGPGGIRRIPLEDLKGFRNAVPQVLEAYILAALKEAGASHVVEERTTGLTRQDLGLFVLHEDGVQFLFPPYHMGAYVEGSFEVFVPKTLINLYD